MSIKRKDNSVFGNNTVCSFRYIYFSEGIQRISIEPKYLINNKSEMKNGVV